ncbi:MAG: hypothetical protein NTV21_11390 [Planctomycetota bacterium]|nr:hypothetical protein [Planctomycetota bacterium]
MFPRLALPALLACALLPACKKCHDCGAPPAPPAPFYDFWEIEPNDGACCPDVVGTVYVGDEFIVGGTIRDDSFDAYDGFGLTSGEPLEIEFFLEPVGTNADLDLGVWDPVVGDFVLLWDSPGTTEGGRFTISGALRDFQLVVMSYSGDSEYRLWVWVDPPALGALAAAPAEAAEPTRLDRAVPLEAYGAALGAKDAPERLELR